MNRGLCVATLSVLLPAAAGAEAVFDQNDDPGNRDDRPESFYLQFEHPLPLLPNARLSHSSMEESASEPLSRMTNPGYSSFTPGSHLSKPTRITRTDIILYYNILDTVASVDVGFNARQLDSSSGLTGKENGSVSDWIPMLYAGVGVDLPVEGLSVGADGSFAGYQGNRLYDLNLSASYTTDWRAGANMGYRYMKQNLQDFDDSYADIEFDGPYAGVFIKF